MFKADTSHHLRPDTVGDGVDFFGTISRAVDVHAERPFAELHAHDGNDGAGHLLGVGIRPVRKREDASTRLPAACRSSAASNEYCRVTGL